MGKCKASRENTRCFNTPGSGHPQVGAEPGKEPCLHPPVPHSCPCATDSILHLPPPTGQAELRLVPGLRLEHAHDACPLPRPPQSSAWLTFPRPSPASITCQPLPIPRRLFRTPPPQMNLCPPQLWALPLPDTHVVFAPTPCAKTESPQGSGTTSSLFTPTC